MVDRARLESVCIERYRGFESLSLRHGLSQRFIVGFLFPQNSLFLTEIIEMLF